jgi:hypothetical protein
MALLREAYQELEEIVGSRYISEDPSILDSYAFQLGAELAGEHTKFGLRAGAVLLPATTEEVQAIVKTCNRYKIKYKPLASGWGPFNLTSGSKAIQIDLRRMNRIHEIDEKNMFAVVEPYVMAAVLQAEAMKVGLHCNMIGAGSCASPLAQACCGLPGHGPTSIYTGHSHEILLGAEWVMPNGEIFRTGSLGSGCGWFCGEGPGPSLRGIAKGMWGPAGSLGIFTKCAIKLSPWPGPATLPVTGPPPAYKYSPLPETLKAYTLAFPTYRDYANFTYKLWDREIAYIAHRQYVKLGNELGPAFWSLYRDPTQSIDNIEAWLEKPEVKKLTEELKISTELVLAGNSLRDIAYKEKVLDQTLIETNGHKVKAMADPEVMKWSLLYLLRLGHKNLNYTYTGTFGAIAFNHLGPGDIWAKSVPMMLETMKELSDSGTIVQCGTDTLMGCTGAMGDGGYVVSEWFNFPNPMDPKSVEGPINVCNKLIKQMHAAGLDNGSEYFSYVNYSEDQLKALPQPERFYWQWRIKQILDPNEIGERSYIVLKNRP